MKHRQSAWTRAEKRFGALTLLGVAALALWGWIDSLPTPPRLDLPEGAFISNLLLSSDQRFLAVGGNIYNEDKLGNSIPTGMVALWDARTLEPQPIYRNSKHLRTFCLSTDSDEIGILNDAQKTFEWHDRATQKLLWRFTAPKPCHAFRRVQFLERRSLVWLSANYDYGSRNFLLSARNGTLVHQWDDEGWSYLEAAVSPDETIYARHEVKRELSGHLTSSLLILKNVDDGLISKRFKVPPPSSKPLFSPDGHSIFLLTFPDAEAPNIANNVVRRLDSRTGQQIWSFDALHVASDINAWRRYQISKQTGTSHNDPYDPVAFLAIAISPDSATIAIIRAIDSTIYLLDARTGKQQRTLALPLGKAEMGSVTISTPLIFAPDGKHLFAHTNDSIFVWDLSVQ